MSVYAIHKLCAWRRAERCTICCIISQTSADHNNLPQPAVRDSLLGLLLKPRSAAQHTTTYAAACSAMVLRTLSGVLCLLIWPIMVAQELRVPC